MANRWGNNGETVANFTFFGSKIIEDGDCSHEVKRRLLLGVSSLVAQTVKCLPTMWETWVQSLGQEDLLEKGMATHSSILGLPWWLRD